jgi:protein O-GlcNAc transferase
MFTSTRATCSPRAARLAAVRDTCPLFDTARFTRNIEAAYLEMARRYRNGQAPEGFRV